MKKRKKKRAKTPSIRIKQKAYINTRLEYWNQFYGFTYNRVTVKKMKTRLGSCSSLRNLNFSAGLFAYSEELIDYVVVHELCHLAEMNHSKRFYELIEKTLPDWKERKSLLRVRPNSQIPFEIS